MPVSDRRYYEEIRMTETTAATYPCVWEIAYRDYDGSTAGAGCDDVATVLFFDPTDDSYAAPRPFSFCTFHAVTEPIGEEVECVQIADLSLTCASCGRPIWAAHAQEHEIGREHRHETAGICRDLTPDHAPCVCPAEAAYDAAMLVAEHAADRS